MGVGAHRWAGGASGFARRRAVRSSPRASHLRSQVVCDRYLVSREKTSKTTEVSIFKPYALRRLRRLRAVHLFSCNLLEVKPECTELIHRQRRMDAKADVRLDKSSCPPVNFCLNLSKICFVCFHNKDIERILGGRGGTHTC